jgi:site-specific DNA-methyltransferase (adenine-specific)
MVAVAVESPVRDGRKQKKQEKVEQVDPGTLKPHPKNQSIYQDEPDEALLRDIEESGISQPIICDKEQMFVISGRRRFLAAKKLGLTSIPVIFREYKDEDDRIDNIIKSNLYRDKSQAQILREVEALSEIELRRGRQKQVEGGKYGKARQMALSSGSDDVPVAAEKDPKTRLSRDRIGMQVGRKGRVIQRALKVIEVAKERHGKSWTKDENVQAIFDGKKSIAQAAKEAIREEHQEAVVRKAATITEPVGDIRCKDNIDDVLDESVDHVIVDPPYGVSSEFSGQFEDRADMSSKFEDWDPGKLEMKEIGSWCLEWCRVLRTGGNVAIFAADRYLSFIMEGLRRYGCEHLQVVTWHKSNPEPSVRQVEFCSSCEYIVVGNKGSKRNCFNWLGQEKMHNFVDGPVCSGRERMGHPTQKPLWLMEWLIERLTEKGDLVLDNFAGTGTTAVACKKLERQFIVVEKSRKHVDTIKVRLSS